MRVLQQACCITIMTTLYGVLACSDIFVADTIIIIIIYINCNWVVTCGSGCFTCIQNMKLVTNKFKSGGLHEKHVMATWNLGNHLRICL